jgi:hypothetical protein
MKNKTYLKLLLSKPLSKEDTADYKSWHESLEKDCENMSEKEFKMMLHEYQDLLITRNMNRIYIDIHRTTLNVVYFVVLSIVSLIIGGLFVLGSLAK